MPKVINENLCPFCKKENLCMARSSAKACWCNQVEVPADLVKLVPFEYQRKSCVCHACIALYQSEPSAFAQQVNISESRNSGQSFTD